MRRKLTLFSLFAVPFLSLAGCQDDSGCAGELQDAYVAPAPDASGEADVVAQKDAPAPEDVSTTQDDAPAGDTTPPEDLAADPGTEPDAGPQPGECEGAGEIPCEDEIILDLSLHADKVSKGAITNEPDGAVFATVVDATAGGYGAAAQNPWVYGRFTAEGLARVDIDDETALGSVDWDIAFKRYQVRLNSGVSGPGCVTAAEVSGAYGDVTEAPAAASMKQESFYTQACKLVEAVGTLPGEPAFTLGSWWAYDGCVKTTGTVYVISAAALTLKITFDAYYKTGQEQCNATGTAGSQSGFVSLRWSPIP